MQHDGFFRFFVFHRIRRKKDYLSLSVCLWSKAPAHRGRTAWPPWPIKSILFTFLSSLFSIGPASPSCVIEFACGERPFVVASIGFSVIFPIYMANIFNLRGLSTSALNRRRRRLLQKLRL